VYFIGCNSHSRELCGRWPVIGAGRLALRGDFEEQTRAVSVRGGRETDFDAGSCD
jgi:hypothetical protein